MKPVANAILCILTVLLIIEATVRHGRQAGWGATGVVFLIVLLVIISYPDKSRG